MRLPNGDTGTVAKVKGNQVRVKTDGTGAIRTARTDQVQRLEPAPAATPSPAVPAGSAQYPPPQTPAPPDSPVWNQPNATGGLSEQDKQDLENYAWDFHSYVDINIALRQDQADQMRPETAALADRVTAIIDRSELPQSATLYRGTFDSPTLVNDLIRAHQSGQPWTEQGFMSTSLTPEHADTFSDMSDPSDGVRFQIQVAAPQGAKAFVFNGALEGRQEMDQREVLLQRGSQFQITSAKRDSEGYLAVKMTLIGHAPIEPLSKAPSPGEGGAGPAPGIDTGSPARFTGPVSEPTADKPYSVITQHEPDRAVRRAGPFSTYEEAKAYLDAHNPDTDGSMMPNLDPYWTGHPEYQSGGFYPPGTTTNRYGAVHKLGSNQYGHPDDIPNAYREPLKPGESVVPHVTYTGPPVKPKPMRREKVMARYGVRVTHNKIPADSVYHLATTDGTYPSGGTRLVHKRGEGVGNDVITSEPNIDNLLPVTPDPAEMDQLSRYADLIDRNTGDSLAYVGWDPAQDMVMVQDPENGNESWIPRKQLIAKHLPDDPYSHGRRDG